MRNLFLALAAGLALAGPASAAPANSPWPMARRDAQKSSSATFNGAAPTGFEKLQHSWSVTLPNSGNAGPIGDSVSLDEDGNAYVTSGDAIFALTKSSGGVIWVSTLPATAFSQPAISNDGRVVTSSANAVVAFSTGTGQHLWTYRPVGATAIDLAGTTASIQSFDGQAHPVMDAGLIYASDFGENGSASGFRRAILALTTSGTLSWAITKGGGFNSSIHPPASDGVNVYFGTSDSGNLYARSIAGGGAFANYSDGFSDGNAAKVTIAGNGDIIHYVNATGRKLERRTSDLSTSVWVTTQTLTNRVWTPAVDGSSAVYATADGRLYGFDFANGNVILNLDMDVDDQYVLGPPTVVSSDTILFTGQRNFATHLYNVNPLTKSLRWRYTLHNGVNANMGQVTVSTHSIFVHTLAGGTHKVHSFIRGTYAGISISSTAETRSGNYLVSTVTVRAYDSLSNPVAGVPIQATDFTISAGGSGFVTALQDQDGLNYSTTNASGEVRYRVTWDYSSWNPALGTIISSTMTFTPLGLSSSSIVLQNTSASTFTIVVSTPAIEDLGSGSIIQVTTVTVTVRNGLSAPVPNHPVVLNRVNFTGICNSPPESSFTPSTVQFTDGAGQTVFIYRLRYTEGSITCAPALALPLVAPAANAYALGTPAVALNLADTRPSTFTVTYSSAVLQSDVRHTTMTVTVYAVGGATVPGTVVQLRNMVNSSYFMYGFNGVLSGPMGTCGGTEIIGYTNSLGQAKFNIDGRGCGAHTFDNYANFTASATIYTPSIASSTLGVPVESNFLDGYQVDVPTITSVGVSFRSTVTAVNAYGHQLPGYTESGVTLTPLFDQTAVQGTGTLGTSVVSFAASAGRVVVSSQTYNKIEDIQIKATRGSGSIKTGTSGTMIVRGPDRFIVTIPTGAAAGQVFTGTITAVDAGGNPVVGYGATLSLTPVLAASTASAGTGSLTPATVNLPANGKVVVNNLTYSKGEGIRVRVFDSSLNIEGYSSSITVTAPALTISHYSITAPTQVSVGLPFSFQVNALDASSAPVTYNLSRAITVQAFLNGTAISGSGSLGTAAMTLQAGSTYTYTASQTYNKIETVQIKVTDEDGRTATSGPILFSGPTQFDVTMPTAALAGSPFQIVVVARDAGNNQVLGYSGTVNIAAVQASNTALSGAGTLGVTSLNVAAGLGTSAFQTYTKAEGVRLRVTDSAIGVTSYSSSATVRAGTPSSITLLANPQSTIAGVPSVLTATVYDAYTNPVTNSTATFSVATGSGVVSLSLANGSVVSAVTSTQAVTDAFGQATAFFSSTNSLSAQSNLLRASIGSLARDTTVYSTVLVTSAGGAVVNFSNPLLRADIPANTYGFSVRLGIASRDELPAADLALTTAAFAATANTFVSTTVLKLTAVRDASPTTAAGAGSKLVTVSMPYTVTSGSISVGAYGAQSILVPLSVMRIFKLNQATSVFEQVIDGVTAVNSVTGVVTAEVSNPDGIYALGAPSFTNLTTGSSATVTTALAGGTTAEVVVPAGGFSAPATITVTVPGESSVPALPVRPGLTALGVTISVSAGGLQPAAPVTIKIGYTLANIAGVNPDHLRLARYDATTGWVVLDSAADTATRQVIGTTDHFSLFQIVAQAPSGSVAEGFVFPNPFRPSRGHTHIKLSNLPADAKIKIFTATGRLLKELEADAAGQVLGWNGTDRDGRALASGVYLAVVEGTGGRRTIKFAVQR